jgi:hypothetical protein
VTGDALRDIHGLAPCGRIYVDNLLVICACLVNQALFLHWGGLGGGSGSAGCLAGGESLAQVVDDLVELFVGDLRSPADHI